MRWTITSAGTASDVEIAENGMGDAEVASCIKGLVNRWRFLAPSGGSVDVVYPLATWLESGGIVMYLLLFGFAPLVAVSGLLHLILASRNSFLQLCICLALVLGVGILATGWHRSRVANVLATTRPDERLHLAIVGYREANRSFELSLAVTLAGLVPYDLGELRRSRRSASRETHAA